MIVIVACVLHCVPNEIAEACSCLPPDVNWEPTIPAKCINYLIYFIVSVSTELALDVIILTLPLKELSNLQMPLRRKIMLSLIFLLGGL
jgi:hypothetical protein